MLERPSNQLENPRGHNYDGRKLEPPWNSDKECTTKHDETEQTERPREMINEHIDK